MAPGRKRTTSPPKSRAKAAPEAAAREDGAASEALEGEVLDPETSEVFGDAGPVVDASEQDAETEGEPSGPSRPAPRPSRANRGAIVPSRERGLGHDPMQSYMAEVIQHPLLTREEEHALAVRYRDAGDLSAAARLVASNLRLVVKLAHEYHRNPLALLDLVQEGNIGLMQAVKKYDPDRGVKLSSYAAWWIRAYILRYIMDNWKMVKLGTTEAQRKLFFKLRQEQERLLQQGFEASPKLLAERLNVTEQDVVEMDQRLGHDEMSLDAPVGDDSRATRVDRLLPNSSQMEPDEKLGNEELKSIFHEHLAEFAKTLNEKDRYIFEKRLIADEPLTLQDIGTHYGVSRERARQVEAALINRMREFMRAKIPDFDMVAVPKGSGR